jgi:two-component system response regulator HydG
LFESQLFGHTKGAFTGATRDEKGFVASAEGGTLFLDEVGELPLSVQPKLLRFLQNGEIQRVGSPLIISTDVRVVAATNRDLANMVNDRGFREDLYYRLAMVQFRVTPLSQRMDDFPQLLRHFLDRYQLEYSKPSLALSARAKRLLQQHSWPGNIRELQHVLAYACMMCTGSVIDLADFPEWWLASLDSTAPLRKALALHDLEQHHIHHVLTQCQGNRTRAAKALGIGRATLYRALAKANSPTSQFSNVLVR